MNVVHRVPGMGVFVSGADCRRHTRIIVRERVFEIYVGADVKYLLPGTNQMPSGEEEIPLSESVVTVVRYFRIFRSRL